MAAMAGVRGFGPSPHGAGPLGLCKYAFDGRLTGATAANFGLLYSVSKKRAVAGYFATAASSKRCRHDRQASSVACSSHLFQL